MKIVIDDSSAHTSQEIYDRPQVSVLVTVATYKLLVRQAGLVKIVRIVENSQNTKICVDDLTIP
ncbi:MAG: hypothetical protein HC849_04075 [Oscillatoriales cyanobacterium RU_3_3]|nr:hypothetical protein [Microcoleus sp. SU_5_3]NJL67191.1 hypothetical protein [Microcoleus sp. SM1_3_4]NJM59547.1 hypothetical protein [Oscillatoriales cyanobacterium RU_3_3]